MFPVHGPGTLIAEIGVDAQHRTAHVPCRLFIEFQDLPGASLSLCMRGYHQCMKDQNLILGNLILPVDKGILLTLFLIDPCGSNDFPVFLDHEHVAGLNACHRHILRGIDPPEPSGGGMPQFFFGKKLIKNRGDSRNIPGSCLPYHPAVPPYK